MHETAYMKRRTWTPPAPPPQGKAAAPATTSVQLQPPPGSINEYIGRLLGYAVLFGAFGIFFQSSFPLALGALLFVDDEKFIEWALAKFGIRFVPDTLGLPFIDAFIFFAGTWALLTAWSDSVPASLKPPDGSPWLVIGATAFGCAALKILSAATVKRLLPRLTPYTQGLAALGLTALALVICAAIFQWF